MCFAKELELDLHYNEDGSLNEPENTPVQVQIPEGVHEHVDHPNLKDDLQDGILAFVYENGNGIHIVYTSFEAELICSNFCEYCGTIHID